MNWLTNFVRPKVTTVTSREIADDLWTKCPKCGQMVFSEELKNNIYVCPYCNYHFLLYTNKRFKMLFDNGEWKDIEAPKTIEDPLKFKDSKKYIDRLKTYRKKTEEEDAIKIAVGKIAGVEAVVVCLSFTFMGGSMGMAVGEGFIKAAEEALRLNCPLIAITASGGARMQEGILSLMQMTRTVAAVNALKEKGLLYITVLTDPTTGGVSASFAMLGDIQIAESGSIIGFAGARVIEKTIREKLPEGFQKAEFLEKHGMVDIVTERKNLKNKLGQILNILAAQKI